ncbi:MAG: Hsp20/alpha crystallin family protein [Leptolyngbyaceae cyanobacterium CRU_2_3]|nr:Hsp20/alpha crystallin family protein [Leptolyngbyaceae cyanobacterium CRU_2_3]
MLVRYWQPWHEMETLRRQVDRLFDDVTEPASHRLNWMPAIELKDNGDTLILRAQIPGVDTQKMNVEVTREAVSIAGDRSYEPQNHENGYYKSEFRYGKFYRTVALPVAVQNDQVQAEYKDGILSLTLPKVAEARHKVVKLNLAELSQATLSSSSELSETGEVTSASSN